MATSPSRLFVDSSVFIALICDDEPLHSAVLAYYDSCHPRTRLMTTLLVVSETYTWLRYHVNHAVAMAFLQSVEDGCAKGRIELIPLGPDLWEQTRRILEKFHDHALSYVDAASFVAIDNFGIKDVLSLDRHFRLLKTNVWPIETNR